MEEIIEGESKPKIDPAGEEQFTAMLKQELNGERVPLVNPNETSNPAQQIPPQKGPVETPAKIISDPAEKKNESTAAVEPEQVKKLEAEVARLTKMVEDNKAGFTKKSMQLADTEKAKAALEAELDELRKAPVLEDIDDTTLAEYPEAIKKSIAKGNAIAKELAELKRKDADRERERQALAEAEEHKRHAQENFQNKILPEILKEVPEYKDFLLPRSAQYGEFLAKQTPGDKFAFSLREDSDPHDLIRGYRAFRTYLGLPPDNSEEAIRKAEGEKSKNKVAFTSYARPALYTPPAPPAQTEPLTEEQMFQKEMEKLKASLQSK
jgi:hypothetical protein